MSVLLLRVSNVSAPHFEQELIKLGCEELLLKKNCYSLKILCSFINFSSYELLYLKIYPPTSDIEGVNE